MDKKTTKLLLLPALACAMLLATGLFTIAASDAGYVGSEKCKECHEDIAATHANSFHAKAWAGKGEGYGCESCHGPAGDHVNNPSRETIISFGKESKQSAGEKSARCLSCHSASNILMHWEMGMHKKEDVACSSCHNIHKGYSPLPKQPETCFGCHKDKKRDAYKQSHHPIIEGKIKCSDCHNPHGALSHGMIKDENVNQLCYQCHPDKRGPYIWEHPPVEENCLTCHNPHGSKTSKMLKEKVPSLCQNCHGGSGGHNTTPWDASMNFSAIGTGATKTVGNVEKIVARSCVNCHSNIHGSMAPASGTGANGGKAFVR